ncbi:type II secretion system F family protein [Streptomyces hoynatensis]|uniref:Type II secretion system protein GspF domain-containing protein n=1 Tax=Streptomyces hoynatensis TaxID=1141874 RepID=A0A3A9Z481_9ACTN|nr:type II secretion system F family protein [Streptomyces hoynatensis]RKN43058.1 hypothetical protein D7294_11175 [Streptomyces hoynatensis]
MTGALAQFTAALCAGAGAWALAEGPRGRRRVRLLTAGCGRVGRARFGAAWWPGDHEERRVLLACLAVGGLLALWGGSVLPVAAAAALAPLAVRRWRRARERRAADRRRDAVLDLCGSLAGEVRGGRPPGQALSAVGTGGLGLGEQGAAVLAAARYGGDVPAALCAAASSPGAEGLRGVAACWEVAVDGGASFASGLDRVAEALRAERDQEEELRAQLAGPRATALVLAALPVFGLLLGAAMGVEPLRILLGTPLGLCCLLLGTALEWAGLAWVAAIVRAAERAGS